MNTIVSPPIAWPQRPWSSLPDRLRDVLAHARRAMIIWAERARTRRQLALLDDANLRDIGVCRAAADFEAGKRFWQE